MRALPGPAPFSPGGTACPVILHLRLVQGGPGDAPGETVLADFCAGISPRWQTRGHQAYLDLSGSGRLFGWGADGPARVCRLAADRLPVLGAGAAATRLAARLASRLSCRWGSGRVLVVPFGNVSGFLAPFPIATLGEYPAPVMRLRELGVRTLGDLQTVPLALLRAVFGDLAHDLAAAAAGCPEAPAAWGQPLSERSTLVAGARLHRPLTSPAGLAALADGLALRALGFCREGPGSRTWWQLRAHLPGGRRQQASVGGKGEASLAAWRGLLGRLAEKLPATRQGLVQLELRAGPSRFDFPQQGLLFPEQEKARRLAGVLGRLNREGVCRVSPASEQLLVAWGITWYGPEPAPGS